MLNLPSLEESHATSANTVDTIAPFTSAENGLATDVDSTAKVKINSLLHNYVVLFQMIIEKSDESYNNKNSNTVIEKPKRDNTQEKIN